MKMHQLIKHVNVMLPDASGNDVQLPNVSRKGQNQMLSTLCSPRSFLFKIITITGATIGTQQHRSSLQSSGILKKLTIYYYTI